MLKKIRKEKGLSQTRLAELTGLSVWTIAGYEQKKRNLKNENLKAILKIANVLEVPFTSILTEEDVVELIEVNLKYFKEKGVLINEKDN